MTAASELAEGKDSESPAERGMAVEPLISLDAMPEAATESPALEAHQAETVPTGAAPLATVDTTAAPVAAAVAPVVADIAPEIEPEAKASAPVEAPAAPVAHVALVDEPIDLEPAAPPGPAVEREEEAASARSARSACPN